MAVTVFLFILLLGGVAGESNSIDDLVDSVERNCTRAGTEATTCANFANQFRQETDNGPDCTSASSGSVNTYSATISALSPTSDNNKMLLWSGKDMGNKARTQSSKTSLDKTPAGRSLHGFHWAKFGSTLKWNYNTEVNVSYCGKGCPYPLENLYWSLASIRFAEQAKGEVEVYLTEKTGMPYAVDSIFRMYEVPNLPKKGATVTVKLYDSKSPSSDCDLTQLEADLKKRDIDGNDYDCVKAGTSKRAATGNFSVTEYYWRPDGTYCDSCMKLPSVITIIIPILTLLLKS
eukprot:XP_011669792.1 PREDICTED: uncharacterized protein LOC105440898 [Strongylocentrotus purpuratus]